MILQRDIHLLKIKYYEDTRPQFQLSDVQEQYDGLCTILQGASITFHTILWGLGGTIYKDHTLEPSKDLGLDFQRATTSFLHSVNYAAKFVHTRHKLSSTTIIKLNSYQDPVSGRACGRKTQTVQTLSA